MTQQVTSLWVREGDLVMARFDLRADPGWVARFDGQELEGRSRFGYQVHGPEEIVARLGQPVGTVLMTSGV